MPKQWSALLAIAICACARPPSPTVAEVEPQEAAPPPFEVEGATPNEAELVVPCARETEAFERARQDFYAIAQRIEQLSPTDDPEPHMAALRELLAGECFALRTLVDDYADDEPPTSGLALRTWWEDGGSDWIEQFLHRETTWIRPSVRVAFAPELTPNHPLADMFCPLAELDCDVQTRGWMYRAELAFEAHAEDRWADFMTDDDELPMVRSWPRCEELAVNKPSEQRYETWLRCVDHVTLRRSVFPIGGLRAPTEGWFVIRGRRGHYDFCDEIRAFDLATGSVHIVASCSGLALRDDGSVDGAQTNAGRVLQERSGRVPVDALREAVWMALWSTEMSNGNQVSDSGGYYLPETVEPMGREEVGFGNVGMASSSAQTWLDWTYVRDGRPSVNGGLTWPADYNNGARDHAVQLLRIAEAAMVEGCAPARVPKTFSLEEGGMGVSALDADREALSDTQRELEAALVRMEGPRCRGS